MINYAVFWNDNLHMITAYAEDELAWCENLIRSRAIPLK